MNTSGIVRQQKQQHAPGSAAFLATPGCREERGAPRRRSAGWLSLLAGAGLLLSTGCSMLGLTPANSETSVHSVDPSIPFVVVTVGGAVQGTPTPGVAATIPESTPLPRLEPPVRDASAPARPVASPSLSRSAPAAAQAGQPAGNPAAPAAVGP